MKDRMYESDKLKYAIDVGLIIEIISFIFVCFEFDRFKSWFWIGAGLTILGSVFLIDYFGSEGKTWFKNLDKKRDKNITRKSSEAIFFIAIICTLIFCCPFIAEFLIKGFSERTSVMAFILVVSIIDYILIKYIIRRTAKEMEEIIAIQEKRKK